MVREGEWEFCFLFLPHKCMESLGSEILAERVPGYLPEIERNLMEKLSPLKLNGKTSLKSPHFLQSLENEYRCYCLSFRLCMAV